MFKRLFPHLEERTPQPEETGEVSKALSERIGRVVKRPERPAEARAQSHLSEPVALPREPLKGVSAKAVSPSPGVPAGDAMRPNDRRERSREQSDKAPPIGIIYLTRQAFYAEDPEEVIRLNTNVVSYFLFEAGYRVEELQQEAFRLYSVDYYITQAAKGGHALFAKRAHGLYPTWRGIREGLEAMEATAHYDIFQAFTAYLREDEERATRIREGSGFGKIDPGIRDFDEQIRRVEELLPIAQRASDWIKSRPAVQLFEPEAMEAAIKALAEHPILQDRRMKL